MLHLNLFGSNAYQGLNTNKDYLKYASKQIYKMAYAKNGLWHADEGPYYRTSR